MSENLEDRYKLVLERIKAAGRSVQLIAVSKTQSVDAIEELYKLGQRDFGENYAQELMAKAVELNNRGANDIRWHFIGHLQTNKVKAVIPYVYAVHSVHSEKLAVELNKRWQALGKAEPLKVFIEVNIDREENKSGVMPEQAVALAEKISGLPQLKLLGLMCIPEFGTTGAGVQFKNLRELDKECKGLSEHQLSMGMTDDFEVAIREGASFVRVGTAIFGARPVKGQSS